MAHIEIARHTPPTGMEYTATSYPGDGAYLLPNGALVFVKDGMVYALPTNYSALVRDGSSSGTAAAGLDVHRMLDQLLDRIGPRR